jgi:hypothetical protein
VENTSLQAKIRGALSVYKEEGDKKQISIMTNERTLRLLDIILDQFKKVTDGKFASSRNQLIEMAIEEFIQTSADVLFEDHKINIEEFLEIYEDEGSDEGNEDTVRNLVLFPATHTNFEKIFLKENCWYSVRINEKNIPNIEYAASYVGAPVSGITHYAKVDRIEKFDDGKYIIYFEGEPVSLKNTVRLGDSPINSVRKLRYSTLDRLLSAGQVSDLWPTD